MLVAIFGGGEVLRGRGDGGQPHQRDPTHGVGILAVIRAGDAAPRTDPHATSLSPQMPVAPGVPERTLSAYYERRAYPGAPPTVPHPVDPETNRTQACNVCHAKGGFTPKFNAYVPVTPHPELGNCLQCHVQGAVPAASFVRDEWLSVRPPALQRPALPGGPPPMPHGLQLRQRCLSCHAGPAAVAAVRTSHPERVNCQQCHVPRRTQRLFRRTGME